VGLGSARRYGQRRRIANRSTGIDLGIHFDHADFGEFERYRDDIVTAQLLVQLTQFQRDNARFERIAFMGSDHHRIDKPGS
jgi:hypothetical protein